MKKMKVRDRNYLCHHLAAKMEMKNHLEMKEKVEIETMEMAVKEVEEKKLENPRMQNLRVEKVEMENLGNKGFDPYYLLTETLSPSILISNAYIIRNLSIISISFNND